MDTDRIFRIIFCFAGLAALVLLKEAGFSALGSFTASTSLIPPKVLHLAPKLPDTRVLKDRKLLERESNDLARELRELHIFLSYLEETKKPRDPYAILRVDVHRVNLDDVTKALWQKQRGKAIALIKVKIKQLKTAQKDLFRQLAKPKPPVYQSARQ